MGVTNALEWTFFEQVKIPNSANEVLLDGEVAKAAFKTVRDFAIFTDLRLIVIDSQGLTGTKKEIYSLPYKSINMWSTENAGMLDHNTEVELWTRAGNFKIKLNKKIDVRQFEKIIGEAVFK